MMVTTVFLFQSFIFQQCHDYLKQHWFKAKLLCPDNEDSEELIIHIKAKQLKYQLASPGDPRSKPAAGAIQTFKNCFITILSGANHAFPPNCWDLLQVSQAVLMLNLLRPSRINPAISAYVEINGIFNFNDTPLVPTGCRIVTWCNHTTECPSWVDRSTDGFYIGAVTTSLP